MKLLGRAHVGACVSPSVCTPAGRQLKIPAGPSAALGVLRGKTKPFSTLIISVVMGQSRGDVTLQDCGPVASDTLF